MIPFAELTSVGGHPLGEVASALQKSIRRGDEDNALFWATELDLSGYGEYAFKRLRIIASEDVGMGEQSIASDIHALYSTWAEMKKKGDKIHHPERLFLVHAVMLLARARKSRAVDNACVVFYAGTRPKREVPDYALDKHTKRGRVMGRGFKHFFEEGARIENENCQVADPYKEAAVKTLVKNARAEQAELV